MRIATNADIFYVSRDDTDVESLFNCRKMKADIKNASFLGWEISLARVHFIS